MVPLTLSFSCFRLVRVFEYHNMVGKVLLFVCSFAALAQADTLYFTYTRSTGPVLSGTFSGSLQPDMNTFYVTGVGPLTYNGGPAPALGFVDSADNYTGYTPLGPAAVTIDASFMDLIACDTPACNEGFIFAHNDQFDQQYNIGYAASAAFGGDFQRETFGTFDAVASPEPASCGLIAGAAMLLMVRRKLLRG